VILDMRDIDVPASEQGSGWMIKPEAACKGDVCVPVPGGFSLPATAERLGMAVVGDAATGLSAVGPESFGGRALVSAEALELPFSSDFDTHVAALQPGQYYPKSLTP
jgi:hypothetical protein